MSTPTRKDWILWGALGCALVATYHAEYTLAVAAGFHPWVALAVPGALDLYVIRALQQRRDVLVAVLAMVAANVASHLIAKDVLQVGWQVIAAVGAIAPLVLWRVYSLKHTRNRQELLHGVQAGALEYTGEVSAPVEYPPAPVRTCPDCGVMWDQEHEYTISEGVRVCPTHVHPPAPDRIPDWMDQEYPVSVVEVHASTPPLPALPPEYGTVTLETGCRMCGQLGGHRTNCPEQPGGPPEGSCPCNRQVKWPDRTRKCPYAECGHQEHSVGECTGEYPALTEDEWDELTASDREYLGELNEYIHSADSHTLAGLRAALGIGQARATRLIKHARKEGVW